MKKTFLLVVLIALGDGGCSYLTSSGRQQAAYARYVRRSSYAHAKMQKKFRSHVKIQSPEIQSEPTVTARSGPESVTAGTGTVSQ
jgi:hypothetical protein